VGAIICLSDIYLWIATESIGVCIARVWVLSIGFVIMFGSLFIKTWRVWKIFGEAKSRVKGLKKITPIGDGQLFGLAGIMVLFVVILLFVFTFWHNGPWFNVYVIPGTANTYLLCNYDPIWPIIFIMLYSGAILVFGVFLAIASRQVTTTFNESKYIGFAIYNCAFMALIAIPIIIIVNNNISAIFVMLCLAILVSVLSSVGIIYFKKIISLCRGEDYHAKFKQSMKSKTISSSVSVKTQRQSTASPKKTELEENGGTVDEEEADSNEQIKKYEEEIGQLKQELLQCRADLRTVSSE